MTYKYLNIRFNSKHSVDIETPIILDFIRTITELKQTDKVQFENQKNYPWGIISLIKCNEHGCFSLDKGEYFEKINLIEFLFSDTKESLSHYLNIATKIAGKFNWELIDDNTNEILINKT